MYMYVWMYHVCLKLGTSGPETGQNPSILGCGKGSDEGPQLFRSVQDMVLWDSRLLHCNVPGFHPFDEMDLQTALADAGLQEAAAEPCRDEAVDSTRHHLPTSSLTRADEIANKTRQGT